MSDCCDLSVWDMDARREPTIRVGVVLPEDDMQQVRLTMPADPYLLGLDDMAGPTVHSTTLEVSVEGERVIAVVGDQRFGPASVLRLAPRDDQPLVRGAGVQVRGVVTGRGFHWQKRMHPALAGPLEARVHDGLLLVVNEVPLEHYLAGVLTAEMSGDCPLEFLKSQVVVARSWVLALTENKHPGLPIHRCNDDDCQRYHGTTHLTDRALEAVTSTRGQVLVDGRREIIDANYSKSCGGISETPENVWSVSKSGLKAVVDAPPESPTHRFFPVTDDKLDEYLSGDWLTGTDVFCSPAVVSENDILRYLGKVDEAGRYFRWKLRYDREDLEQVLRDKYFARLDPAKVAAMTTLVDLRVSRRGVSGRAIEIDLQYLDPMRQTRFVKIADQHRIRDVLHEKFLYSSAFKVDIERDEAGLPRTVTLTGAGWGHGAGMCQIGALGMAIRGYSYQDIVNHYFEGISIYTAY